MNKDALRQALGDSEAEVPGHLYRDIVSWTYVDFTTRTKLIKSIFEKLDGSSSAFVLYKALHLTHVLCEGGHADVQRELRLPKYTATLKRLTAYRGALDAQHGSTWHAKVRQEAEAALEAVFSSSVSNASAAMQIVSGGTASNATGDLTGMGNSNFSPSTRNGTASRETTVASHGASSADSRSLHIGEMPRENRWEQYRLQKMQQQSSGGGGGAGEASLLQHLTSTAKAGIGMVTQLDMLKSGQEKLYGDQFGAVARRSTAVRGSTETGSYQPVGLVDVAPDGVTASLSSPYATKPLLSQSTDLSQEELHRSSWPSQASPTSPPSVPTGDGATKELHFFRDPHQLGSDEAAGREDPLQRLISDYAEMKHTPQRVELTQLVQQVQHLMSDGDEAALGPSLNTHLALRQPWQHRHNTLLCIEALLRLGSDNIRDFLRRFYAKDATPLRSNVNVVQSSLHERALRVMELLDIREVSTVPAQPNSQTAPKSDLPAQKSPTTGIADVPVSSSTAVATTVAEPIVNFGGMTIRRGGGQRRSGAPLDNGIMPSSSAMQGSSRPLRRPVGMVAAAVNSPKEEIIQCSRTIPSVSALPIATSEAQCNVDELADLFGSFKTAQQEVSYRGIQNSTLLDNTMDDLFSSGSLQPNHRQSATPVSTDELFASPALSLPASSCGDSDHQLKQIHELMKYLEVTQDDAATGELQRLFMQRQQRQYDVLRGQGGNPQQEHRIFQIGASREQEGAAKMSNKSFSEMQEEMKRRMQ